MLDSANGVSQAWVQDVRLYLRREVELLDVTQSIEPALPELIDISEQAVLPQDGGKVRFFLEMLVRHFLQRSKVLPRESVDADRSDEGAYLLLYAADICLSAGVIFRVIVQGGILGHEVRRDLVGALGEL